MFQTAIGSEDVMGILTKNFTLMGKTHARRSTPKKSYFELRDVVLEVLTEACELNEEQQIAWMMFLNNTIHAIFSKYDEFTPKDRKH